ncbi:hypothetical protein NG895_27865 [Aeoliella sp. ICT_H6.2]|uniref:Peptidase S54 rhomboid domain-containing protein n=1 Tax=Aeoliella straminimaris TaxID=2954799 RepID=A0A9X2FFE0_9BACT|nr:hypothetical protein [Aeoliella straminimaris]MCO6047739.1 hypothetical protein [Aeoliella straminimaris]
MKLLDGLERRLSPYAIPNITLLLILGQVLVYVADMASLAQDNGGTSLVSRMMLLGQLVYSGEVWRVFTFVFVPPNDGANGLLFNLIAWLFFYFIGSVLEGSWGVFRYNMYLLVGYLATVAAAFLQPAIPATNAFFLSSVFLAFARLYPDYVIRLFYILPIKAKWLAYFQWALLGGVLVTAPAMRWMILATIANYLLFFWKDHLRAFKDSQRRARFQAKAAPSSSKRLVHVCGVCGRSSAEEPKTSFRYCSQCVGQQCYCPDHIRDHEHVVEAAAKK